MVDDQVRVDSENDKDNESDSQAAQEEAAHTICVESLQLCQQELETLKNSYQRMTADFDNIKKRMEKERQQWTRAAQAEVLIGLLPIIDNFERAFGEKKHENISPELHGFQLIYKEFLKYLDSIGVESINLTEFDPHFHEAVTSVESDLPSGHIVQVLQKGYLFKNQVLRPAKVSIAK